MTRPAFELAQRLLETSWGLGAPAAHAELRQNAIAWAMYQAERAILTKLLDQCPEAVPVAQEIIAEATPPERTRPATAELLARTVAWDPPTNAAEAFAERAGAAGKADCYGVGCDEFPVERSPE